MRTLPVVVTHYLFMSPSYRVFNKCANIILIVGSAVSYHIGITTFRDLFMAPGDFFRPRVGFYISPKNKYDLLQQN